MTKRQSFFRFFPLFLILYEFCTNMSNDMYLPALPAIAEGFQISISRIQLSIAAWLAGDSAVQLLIGPLADRYGRRPILFGGGVVFLLATLGCALSPSLSWLIFSRFFQGIGVCTMMVAGYASIHDLYDDEKAIHILTWMGSAAVIAPAIGPVFGGWLLLITSWQMIFFILFALGAVSLLALHFCMPESASLHRHHLSLNVSTLISSYRRILSNGPFMLSGFSFALLYSAIIGWITTSPFILMETLKMSPTEFGYVQFFIFSAYVIGARLVKLIMNKRGKEFVVVLGQSICVGAATALILFSTIAADRALSFVLPMVIFSGGFGLVAAPLNRITLTATQEQRGMAIAIFYLTMMGTGTLISLLLSVFNATPLLICVVIALAIALSFLLNLVRSIPNKL
jgi:Bcr/CflA subfamily drug resistance transporter